jgi:hypothetical protein
VSLDAERPAAGADGVPLSGLPRRGGAPHAGADLVELAEMLWSRGSLPALGDYEEA